MVRTFLWLIPTFVEVTGEKQVGGPSCHHPPPPPPILNGVKMKPVDLKSKTYINFNKENDYKNPKFEVVDYVRTAKYKNIFAEGYVPNGSEEFLLLKVKSTVPWTYLIENLNGEKIIGTFTKKSYKKQVTKKLGQKK